jgi:hypothetical protein
MKLIERVAAHFDAPGVQSVEVPEWGEEGKPLVIYWKPITLQEKQRLATVGMEQGMVVRLVEALIIKALDAEGNKLFDLADKATLLRRADPEVVARIVTQMMASPGVKELGKP